MMNSNGCDGATPTSPAAGRARARSGGLLSSSQLTKNASFAVAPISAPRCHRRQQEARQCEIAAWRASGQSFGSNTAHCVAASIAFSIIISSRRTLTKRQSGSLLTVRAPKMRRPRPGSGRIALMPTGLSTPCTASSIDDGHILRPDQRRVGRRLVHAELQVGLRVLPGDVAARRNVARQRGWRRAQRIDHAQPRIVEGGVLRVEAAAPGAHRADAERVVARRGERRVEQRDAIAQLSRSAGSAPPAPDRSRLPKRPAADRRPTARAGRPAAAGQAAGRDRGRRAAAGCDAAAVAAEYGCPARRRSPPRARLPARAGRALSARCTSSLSSGSNVLADEVVRAQRRQAVGAAGEHHSLVRR